MQIKHDYLFTWWKTEQGMIPQSGVPILCQVLQLRLDQPQQALPLEFKVPEVVTVQGPKSTGPLCASGGFAARGAAEALRELYLVVVGAGGRYIFQLLYGATRSAAVADHGYYVHLEIETRNMYIYFRLTFKKRNLKHYRS